MEPVGGALGLVASIGTVVSVIGKSVQVLTTLRQKYKEAELNIGLLTGHLRTVRAALFQVQNWAEECVPDGPQHEQLMFDLEDAVNGCGISVEYLHLQLSKFEWKDNDLRVGSKVQLILEDQTTKDFLDRLSHQITALNLLITAFKCRTPNEQKQFLERRKSREVLDQVKDDAASLLGCRDSASFTASTARNSIDTQFSKTFVFDGLLLRHRVYQNSFRSLLRRAASPTESRPRDTFHRRAQADSRVLQLKSTAKDSARIDTKLREDGRRLSEEIKILAVGHDHGRSAIVKQMRHRYGHPFPETEVEQYRRSITCLVVQALVAILDYVKDLGAGLVSQVSRDHAAIIREFATAAAPEWRIPYGVATSVRHIWHTWQVRQAFSTMEQYGHTAYYLNAIERICRPEFMPTNMDIIRAPETIETMKETELDMAPLTSSPVRIIEIREQFAMKIIPQFADILFCLYAIDLTCYDRYLDNVHQTNAFQERLSFLKAICQSSLFAKTTILLVLTNASAFEKKLAVSPLKSHFDDYTGGNDAEAATKYVLKSCKRANQADLPLFWHKYDCAVEEAAAEATYHFFGQTAVSMSAMSWLRVLGF